MWFLCKEQPIIATAIPLPPPLPCLTRSFLQKIDALKVVRGRASDVQEENVDDAPSPMPFFEDLGLPIKMSECVVIITTKAKPSTPNTPDYDVQVREHRRSISAPFPRTHPRRTRSLF